MKIDIDKLLKEVANREGCDIQDIEWYSWPQSFPTTSGPSGGIGGNTISTWQVVAFIPPNGRKQKWCGGKWKHWNGQFQQQWAN